MNILIISPTLPMYDRNAGDYRLLHIIKMLAIEHTLSFYSTENDVEDPCYSKSLLDIGVEVITGVTSIKTILNKKNYDVSIIEFYYLAEYYLPRIRLCQPKCRVIIDTVDVHYLRMSMKARLINNYKAIVEANKIKHREIAIYKQADAVITVTNDDTNGILSECNSIITYIVPLIYDIVTLTNDLIKDKDINSIIFVGGFIHEPNVDAVMYFVADVLPVIWSKRKAVRFYIVGSNPPQCIIELASKYSNVIVTGHVKSTTPYLLSSYVSVAPLRFGAGMKGKIVEAMSHGLPVVTTSVGAQGMGFIDKYDVRIADSPVEFADAVLDLIDNKEIYENIRSNGIKHIENNFTSQRVSLLINNALTQTLLTPIKKISISNKIKFYFDYMLNKIIKFKK
jgi:glycosyltransferase involved in cell wall biosynthesis